MNLNELKDLYLKCNKCNSLDCSKKIFGYGNTNSNIVVVEDILSEADRTELTPFASPSRELLSRILLAIKIYTENLYFTTTILCKSDKKTHLKEEYINCSKRLFEELSIIKPKFILLVGDIPLKTILGENNNISQKHGEWFTPLSDPCFFYFPIYSPQWILDSETEGEAKIRRRIMWEDIQSFQNGILTLNS